MKTEIEVLNEFVKGDIERDNLYDKSVFIRSALKAMRIHSDQFKPKWVSAKVGDQIETGWYWVRFLHHDTGIEGEEVVFMTDEIPYHYATAISRVEPPKTV